MFALLELELDYYDFFFSQNIIVYATYKTFSTLFCLFFEMNYF